MPFCFAFVFLPLLALWQFPVIKANPWTKVFNAFTPEDAIDLISKLLVYTPTSRYDSFDAMTHPYFDDLRVPNCTLPGYANGRLFRACLVCVVLFCGTTHCV